MTLKRREFLIFLGGVAGSVAIGSVFQGCQSNKSGFSMPFQSAQSNGGLSFQAIRSPIPSAENNSPLDRQIEDLKQYQVADDLVLPDGFYYDVIASWGDKVGDSRLGYNNDYLSFVETAPNEGFLTMNFEYISSIPWQQSYEKVLGKSLPFEAVGKAIKAAGKDGIDVSALPDRDPLKAQIQQIAKEALIDQGMGVISIRKNANGKWERTYSNADRRITGISGLDNPKRTLKCTGPAKAVFRKTKGQGFIDRFGDRIIGTFGNCAGGTTPWGTVLSGEENIQVQVPDAVYADGTSFAPSQRSFYIDNDEISGQGNAIGLAGNKYGWVVEVDPANPNDYGTKHTWLGRYRHEAVGVRVTAGKPIAFYSGCDRRGGHLYKFVSRDSVQNPTDKANSKLLENGMLYAAKFNPDGTGQWIALNAETAIDPDSPSQMVGHVLMLPDRPKGGYRKVTDDAEIAKFKAQFQTLGDLYTGNATEQQGAILIDAHYAANACGATCTARPEDTEVAPDGSLYIAFTSGAGKDTEGGPDRRIFKGPKGETPYEYGFIMHLTETQTEPNAMTFNWQMMALGGEASTGGAGFANPDNLLIDPQGHVWMVCDMSSDKMNKVPKDASDRRGLFGNNGLWFIPTSGDRAGKAHLFAMGPMECELTGPFLSRDQQTLFLAVQHPGEINGIRQAMKSETREFTITAPDRREFVQQRTVPIGSNFPSGKADTPPKPSIVAIMRR